MYSLILELINMQEELAGQVRCPIHAHPVLTPCRAAWPTRRAAAPGSRTPTWVRPPRVRRRPADPPPETMRKQVDQQQAEYNRLSDELNKSQGNVSDKRKD